MLLGTADARKGIPVADTMAAYPALIDELRGLFPGIDLAIIIPPHCADPVAEALLVELAAQLPSLEALSTPEERVVVIDARENFDVETMIVDDEVHTNPLGDATIADSVYAGVAAKLPELGW